MDTGQWEVQAKERAEGGREAEVGSGREERKKREKVGKSEGWGRKCEAFPAYQ